MVLLVGFLVYWKQQQRLGNPGVRVAEAGEAGELDIEFPKYVLDYEARVQPVSEGVVNTLPPDTTVDIRFYRAPDSFEMQLMGVLMGTDRTSIHQPEFCLTGAGFKITESTTDTISVGGDEPYELPVMVLKSDRVLNDVTYTGFYIYWFVAEGRATAHHWERMWWMAQELFTSGQLQRWAYVSCFTVCDPQYEEGTLLRMKRFLAKAIPEFQPRPGVISELGGAKENGEVADQLSPAPDAVAAVAAPSAK